MKKKALIALGSILIIFLSILGWFFYEALNSPAGPPNPPINKAAICTIVQNEDGIFIITCINNNTVIGSSPLYVAQSNQDLKAFVGKKVRIDASFLMNETKLYSIRTNVQCIQNQCRPLFKDKSQDSYAIVIKEVKEL